MPIESILSGIFPKHIDISNELTDLLSKILNTNPKKRISLKNFLLHPWLKIDNYNNKPKANLNIFTKAEQIIYEESNQNIQTISFVFTPYNTRREKNEDDVLYYYIMTM